MPSVIALVPGAPATVEGRTLSMPGITLNLRSSVGALLEDDTPDADLLVLTGMSVEQQQRTVIALRQQRRWRLVPVLYVVPPGVAGMPVPATFRPEMDGLAKGELGSAQVERKIRALAREGVAGMAPVSAGPLDLDPMRRCLRAGDAVIALTEREADVLAILMARAGLVVPAAEMIEKGLGARPDQRSLQNLRRHVSNLRHKLGAVVNPRALQTVRGLGYRLVVSDES